MAFPLRLLGLCKAVLVFLLGAAAEAEEGNWVPVGIRCRRGVVRSPAGNKAAVDLPQGHTCLVRLASDVQSPGLGQIFFNVLKLKLCL